MCSSAPTLLADKRITNIRISIKNSFAFCNTEDHEIKWNCCPNFAYVRKGFHAADDLMFFN